MKFIKKHLLIIVCVIALLLVGTGVYFGRLLNEQNSMLMTEVQELKTRLEDYYRDEENAPSPYLLRRLEREKLAVEGTYESLAGRYAILPFLTLPDRETFPVLYYKEMVYHIFDTIYSRAERLGVALPAALGVPETGLPATDEIPTLFVMLDTVKRLCDEIFASRLLSLDTIQMAPPQRNPFFVEVPFAVTVSGTSSRVAYFLENLGSSKTIFVLENMAMTGTPERVQASLSLNRILWGEEMGEKITEIRMPVDDDFDPMMDDEILDDFDPTME